MNNNRENNNNLIVGLIMIGISSLIFLILVGVFGKSGEYVKNFFLGTFGLSCYGLTIASLIIGVLKCFRFHLNAKVSRIVEVIAIYTLFVLALHSTSYEYMTKNYGEYIANCYYSANTAGGVLGAIVMYPLLRVNFAFAITIPTLLLFGVIALAMFGGKVNLGAVRTRSVKYSKKDRQEEKPTHIEIDTSLKNEDINGKELKDIKTRSRFSKAKTDYVPIEEVETFDDDEFKVEYKDNYAFDSASNEEVDNSANTDNIRESTEDKPTMSKFERMRQESMRASEILYGKKDDDAGYPDSDKDKNLTDKDKFREAVEKIRQNQDTTYLSNLTSNNDDYELYSMEARKQIYRENMEKERLEKLKRENEDQDREELMDSTESIDNTPDYIEEEIASSTSEFNIDDIKLDDEDGNYNFDNFEAFTSEETSLDNTAIEEETSDDIISLPNQEASDEVDEKIENDTKKALDSVDDIKDESANYDIDDFSSSLDKTFDIKKEEHSPYAMTGNEETYKNESKIGPTPDKRVENIEQELLEEDNKKTRARRSDFGGTHNSSHPYDEDKKKEEAQNNEEKVEDTAEFINPFANIKKEEPKVEEVKEEEVVETKPFLAKSKYKYKAPPMNLLVDYIAKNKADRAKEIDELRSQGKEVEDDETWIKHQCMLIEANLKGFGISAKVDNVVTGPTFSRIELAMDMGSGKSVKAIKNLSSDIEMWLGCNGHVNILAPIPGKMTVGIEVPNKRRSTVGLREVFNSPEFNNPKLKIPFALGKDIDNKSYVCDITKAPHMLIAGSTGSGKSVGIASLLNSILYKCSPDEVKLILIDPKKVELNSYRGLPHMLIKDPVSEPNQVLNVLKWLIDEMERRYTALCEANVSNIDEYNQKRDNDSSPRMPYILLVIDEVADLMLELKKNLEDRINKLAAKSRAAGIHIVLATQRPSVDIITGSIKANLPSRIAFATVQAEDSRTILGSIGAERLLRLGDMLYMDSASTVLNRIQGAFICKDEINAITDYVRDNNPSTFDGSIQSFIEKVEDEEEDNQVMQSEAKPNNGANVDEKFVEALDVCIRENTCTTSLLQRKLGMGYPRAAKVIDQLTEYGYIKNKKVLISREQFEKIFGENNGEN